MSLLEDISLDDITLGELLRIPCEYITAQSTELFHPILLQHLSEELKKSQENISPIFIKRIAEDEYYAIHNTLTLAAAKKAKLDFVFCIAINEQMEHQILLETGEILQISLLDASLTELVAILEFAKEKEAKLNRIQVDKVAQTIMDFRSPSWRNLKPLSKLRCGVGLKTAPIVGKYFIFPS